MCLNYFNFKSFILIILVQVNILFCMEQENKPEYLDALEVYEELDNLDLEKQLENQYSSKTIYKNFIKNPGILYFAVELEDERMVQNIVAHINSEKLNLSNATGKTALHLACMKKNLNIIKLLLDYHANVNLKDSQGLTPLHYACQENYVDLVKFLVNYGANLYIVDNDGNTPLHIACIESRLEIIEYYIYIKVNLNNINSINSKSPLDLLIQESVNQNYSNNNDITLSNNLDINNPQNNIFNANKVYFISKEGLKIAQLLIANGATSNYYKMEFVKDLIDKFSKRDRIQNNLIQNRANNIYNNYDHDDSWCNII